ncbi:hypothetical protein DMUE_6305, partial [Dictyocoela muelleri]
KKINLLSNTLFDFNRISIEIKLALIQYWLLNMPISAMSQTLNINKSTISRFISKLSNKIVPSYMENLEKIGGPNVIVEIDETKIGKRKYHRGHHVEGVWVLGMVERTDKRRIIVIDIEKRDAATLTSLVRKYVRQGSIIFSDCWRGYNSLREYGYIHFTVNHSRNFVDPLTNVHTNTIEGNWCALKRLIPIRCRTRILVKLYLVRYMIVRNEDCALRKIIVLALS